MSRKVVVKESVDTKAVDTKAVDTKAVDAKAVDTKAVDTKAVDTKAVDTKAVDAKAVDAKAVDAKAVAARKKKKEAVDKINALRKERNDNKKAKSKSKSTSKKEVLKKEVEVKDKTSLISKRLDSCKVSKEVLDINKYSVNSQAQLIDLAARSTTAMTSHAIARKVLLHKDCSKVFKIENVDFATVLKRVKRHCSVYANMQSRIIKRNSYLI